MKKVLKKVKGAVEKAPFYNSLMLPYHYGQAAVAGSRAGWPAKGLKVIGITGTNGKTSTAFMVWKMLNQSGRKAGLMTTVAWGVDELEPELGHMTTVDAATLNRRIKKIAATGAEYLVLEVTSHALAQNRIMGVPIEVAVFTNLTHEHLDYHKTFERYREAKMKLFKRAKFGVVNADDAAAKYFLGEVAEKMTYGIEKGDLRAKEIDLSLEGVKYVAHDYSSGDIKNTEKADSEAKKSKKYASGDIRIEMKIPGKFTVYNSLAAVAVGRRLGLSDVEIAKGLASLDSVEGRMNRVDEGQNFGVIVDYAHTPDALEKAFAAVAGTAKRIIAVHGGAGRRDETTRAERGEILGREADYVIITEDDSRDEDPEKIAAQFVEGAEKAGKKTGVDLELVLDRRAAIRRAFEVAKRGDLVMILGKGHEKTILRADGAYPFEDIKVAQELLRKKK